MTTNNTAKSINKDVDTLIGLIADAVPKINNKLNVLEPSIFPRAISSSPFNIATTDVTNSGREVPIATIVSPISLSLMPKVVAISFEEFTTS